MPVEYRTVVREFELERILSDINVDRDYFGVGYANTFLERIYETDARKLNELFHTFPEALQILYALNVFVGEVCNGGISQFFFNAKPVLWDAVPRALEQIDARETLSRCSPLFVDVKQQSTLHTMQQHAETWDDFLDFKDEMGQRAGDFDDWFFKGQQQLLDVKMRLFIHKHLVAYARVCDGQRGLEREWTRRVLDRLIRQYRHFHEVGRRNARFALFDHLFHPETRKEFAPATEDCRRQAEQIADSCFPSISRAYYFPFFTSFETDPAPQITIPGLRWFHHKSPIVIRYYECHQMDMLWGIVSWNN